MDNENGVTIEQRTERAWGGLATLELLANLFTASPRETFSRDEVLVILQQVREMGDVFPPAVVIAFQTLPEEGQQ